MVVATQRQAVNALAFFYREVLGQDAVDFSEFRTALLAKRLPVVLGCDEMRALLGTEVRPSVSCMIDVM